MAQGEKLPLLELLPQQDVPKSSPEPPKSRPATKNVDVCECCHVRPVFKEYDRRWCCRPCGEAIYAALDAEALKAVPPPKKKGWNGR